MACRIWRCGVWIALICLVFSQPAAAQTTEPLPSRPIALWAAPPAPAQHVLDDEELARWIKDYKAWQEWDAEWINRRQWVMHPFPYPFWKEMPDVFSYIAARRIEPEPPAGLEAECARWSGTSTVRGDRGEGCRLLAVWKDDYITQRLRYATAVAIARKDHPSRTRFLEYIHFASLSTSMQPGGERAYGLAGVHATIPIKGRWQVYALPGIMAVSVPTAQGHRSVTIGYDWGMAVRMFDVDLPIIGVPVRTHLNLVHVWLPEVNQKIDMIGLSFTINRNR
jgi:hypothetical protein